MGCSVSLICARRCRIACRVHPRAPTPPPERTPGLRRVMAGQEVSIGCCTSHSRRSGARERSPCQWGPTKAGSPRYPGFTLLRLSSRPPKAAACRAPVPCVALSDGVSTAIGTPGFLETGRTNALRHPDQACINELFGLSVPVPIAERSNVRTDSRHRVQRLRRPLGALGTSAAISGGFVVRCGASSGFHRFVACGAGPEISTRSEGFGCVDEKFMRAEHRVLWATVPDTAGVIELFGDLQD